MENKFIEGILNHRSIRAWKDTPLKEETVSLLMDVMNHTATSNGLLQASVIRVKDKDKRIKISEIAQQPYLATAPELFIFAADCYRNKKVLEEDGLNGEFAVDADRFLQGITDAAIMAQNLCNAAESMGLGTVYFGSVINEPRKLIEILKLPKYTMPVVGMGIGYPNQEPLLKPRMDKNIRMFEEEYQTFSNYHERLASYDEDMLNYYDLRDKDKKKEKFTLQLKNKLSTQREARAQYFKVARDQGFDL